MSSMFCKVKRSSCSFPQCRPASLATGHCQLRHREQVDQIEDFLSHDWATGPAALVGLARNSVSCSAMGQSWSAEIITCKDSAQCRPMEHVDKRSSPCKESHSFLEEAQNALWTVCWVYLERRWLKLFALLLTYNGRV